MTKKVVFCKACFAENRVKSMATDRVELEKELGENLKMNCAKCGKQYTAHVNDVVAKPSSIITAFSILLGVALTAFFWNFGFIAYASLGIPFLIYKTQQGAAYNFNKYKIS